VGKYGAIPTCLALNSLLASGDRFFALFFRLFALFSLQPR
jgi:hypothetical protein